VDGASRSSLESIIDGARHAGNKLALQVKFRTFLSDLIAFLILNRVRSNKFSTRELMVGW
jgi:hypothetical protein